MSPVTPATSGGDRGRQWQECGCRLGIFVARINDVQEGTYGARAPTRRPPFHSSGAGVGGGAAKEPLVRTHWLHVLKAHTHTQHRHSANADTGAYLVDPPYIARGGGRAQCSNARNALAPGKAHQTKGGRTASRQGEWMKRESESESDRERGSSADYPVILNFGTQKAKASPIALRGRF